MAVFYVLLLFVAFTYGFPNSAIIKDIARLKNGDIKSLLNKDLYSIVRSPEIQSTIREAFSEALQAQTAGASPNNNCECCGYDCGCCLHVELKEIGLDSIVCVNVSYLPTDYGISVTLSIDGRTIINETVSARNPPPICADVPYLKKWASICLRFYDLNVNSSQFHGCLKLEARLAEIFKEDVDIGCFTIPLKQGMLQGRELCDSEGKNGKGRQLGYKMIQINKMQAKAENGTRSRIPDISVALNGN